MRVMILVVLCLASFSIVCADEPVTGWWEVYCEVDFAYDGDELISLYNLPDGSGSPFSMAQLPSGAFVDATIRMQLFDAYMDPIGYFPAEDMWLESREGGLISCAAGTIADSNTDADGWTTWAEPMNAGGFSTSDCDLLVMGMFVMGWSDPHLRFNSADLNGDLVVDLMDIALFSGYYFGSYDYAADFFYDGHLDLNDIARMATALGSSCP